MTRPTRFPFVSRWAPACASLLIALPLQAATLAQVPRLPFGNGGPNLAGLSAHYSVAASTVGDAEFDSKRDEIYPPDWSTRLTRAGSVAGLDPVNGKHNSSAEYVGHASFGSLRGHTSAGFEILGNADAVLQLTFLDTLQADSEGILNFSFLVSGSVDRSVHPILSNVFAASSAVAELFIWRYGEQPAPGSFFNFTSYGRFVYRPNEEPVLTRAEGLRATPGSRWVVAGLLHMESHAFGNQAVVEFAPPSKFSSSADFEHTATLLITPDPSTPNIGFTTASGARYDGTSPVPLPPALPLLGLGLGILAARSAMSPDSAALFPGYERKDLRSPGAG